MQYCFVNAHTNASISCKNLVKIGPVVFDISGAKSEIFLNNLPKTRQNYHIVPNISEHGGPIFISL